MLILTLFNKGSRRESCTFRLKKVTTKRTAYAVGPGQRLVLSLVLFYFPRLAAGCRLLQRMTGFRGSRACGRLEMPIWHKGRRGLEIWRWLHATCR
jgi:hypothetical protein